MTRLEEYATAAMKSLLEGAAKGRYVPNPMDGVRAKSVAVDAFAVAQAMIEEGRRYGVGPPADPIPLGPAGGTSGGGGPSKGKVT